MSSLREAVSSNRFHFSTTEGVGGRLSSGIYAAYDRVQQTDDATSHTPPPPPTTFSSFGDDGTLDAGHGTALSVYSTQDDGEEGDEHMSGRATPIARSRSPGGLSHRDRVGSVGARLSIGSPPVIVTGGARQNRDWSASGSSPLRTWQLASKSEAKPASRPTGFGTRKSHHNIFEIVSSRLGPARGKVNSSTRGESREELGYVNSAHTGVEGAAVASNQLRKQRRKELDELFGKKRRMTGVDPSSAIAESGGFCDEREFWMAGGSWTVFDPAGQLAYWWSFVVSLAFLYNFWVLIYRFAFEEVKPSNIATWFAMDYTADFIYVLDVLFHFRTGYLEDGVLQTDTTKLRKHYVNSTRFYVDCLSLLPLDFLYLSIGIKSALRSFRLVKIYRYWAFLDHTERHTNYPNVIRAVTLLHYLLAIYHWNACLINTLTGNFNRTDNWRYPRTNGAGSNETEDIIMTYLHSLYWSTVALTTSGHLPTPGTKAEHAFIIFQIVFGLLLFATILGHVSNIVTSISAARKDFQTKLDNVKTYMTLRRVPMRLQDRVIKWFDYLWTTKKSSSEEKTLRLLPDKLKAEIALHVHLDTLKRVEIFQNTEAGFLCELVLRLRPVLFSPGDYICRKGEVGKEMYIVNRGRLQVVADNGRTVLATLRPGSYFGEISILNMGNAGNRRTASVRSVGYSDLFCLSKNDLWEVLKDYPKARIRLEAIAVRKLENDLKKSAERSSSLNRGKEMEMQRLHQRPTTGGATSSPLATEAAAAAAVDTSSKADSLLATSASGDRPETTSGYRLECRDLDSSLDSRDCATLTSSSSQQHQHQHQQQTTSGTPIVVQLSQACAAELHATPPQLIRPSPFLPPSAPFASQLAPPHPLSAPSNLTGFVIPQEVYAVGPGNGTTGLLTPVHFLAASGTLSQTNLVYTQPPAQHSLFVHEPASRAFPVHQPLTFQTTEHRHSGDCHYLGLCGVRDRLEHYQNSIGKAGSTGCLPDTSVSPEMHSHGVICRELNELRERLRQFESKMAARDDSSLEVTAAARESSPLGVVRIGDRSELTPNFSTAYTCASRIDLTSTQFV